MDNKEILIGDKVVIHDLYNRIIERGVVISKTEDGNYFEIKTGWFSFISSEWAHRDNVSKILTTNPPRE